MFLGNDAILPASSLLQLQAIVTIAMPVVPITHTARKSAKSGKSVVRKAILQEIVAEDNPLLTQATESLSSMVWTTLPQEDLTANTEPINYVLRSRSQINKQFARRPDKQFLGSVCFT